MESGPRVAVLGLGAVGSMTLWALARRGFAVTGFERGQPGHDDAAYGGYTRQFRLGTHDRHHAEHVPLASRSLELWRELEAIAGQELLVTTGQLGVGPADDPDISMLQANMNASGLNHRVMTPAEVMDAYPAHRLAEHELGVFVDDAGVLRSNMAVAAAANAAGADGAEILVDEPVTEVSPGPGSQVTVTAGGRARPFDHVIVTTGPWVGELVPELRSAVTPRAIVTGWHAAPAELSGPDRFPPGFRRGVTEEAGFTFLPAVDGRSVKVIHWMPLRPEVRETATWDRAIDAEVAQAVAPHLAAVVPGIGSTPEHVEIYLEGFTADRFPVISRPAENLTVLSGFSGMGFAVAPAFGEIACDLATGANPNFDLKTFEGSRFATAAHAGCA